MYYDGFEGSNTFLDKGIFGNRLTFKLSQMHNQFERSENASVKNQHLKEEIKMTRNEFKQWEMLIDEVQYDLRMFNWDWNEIDAKVNGYNVTVEENGDTRKLTFTIWNEKENYNFVMPYRIMTDFNKIDIVKWIENRMK